MKKIMNPTLKWDNLFFKLQGHTCSMVLKDVASITFHADQLPNQFFKPQPTKLKQTLHH